MLSLVFNDPLDHFRYLAYYTGWVKLKYPKRETAVY